MGNKNRQISDRIPIRPDILYPTYRLAGYPAGRIPILQNQYPIRYISRSINFSATGSAIFKQIKRRYYKASLFIEENGVENENSQR